MSEESTSSEPSSAAAGNDQPMVHADQVAHQVRHHQADKSDRPGNGDGPAGQQQHDVDARKRVRVGALAKSAGHVVSQGEHAQRRRQGRRPPPIRAGPREEGDDIRPLHRLGAPC